jgi:hypothetical protein
MYIKALLHLYHTAIRVRPLRFGHLPIRAFIILVLVWIHVGPPL